MELSKKKERKRNVELFDRLKSPQKKEVLGTLASSYRKVPLTGKTIQAIYTEATGNNVKPSALVETLNEAAEIDLVRKGVANREDDAVLVWKPRFQSLG